MATMAFDSLRYARRLREVGVPESQAEVQAELMAEAFGFYAENILTRDHFTAVVNARFAEQDAKFDQRLLALDVKLDKRLAESDAKFDQRLLALDVKLDKRFAESDAKFDQRLLALDAKLDQRFAEQDAKFDQRFAESDAKLDKRFAESDAKFDGRFTEQELRFERRFGRLERSQNLHTWMLGILVIVLVIPQLQVWLT